MYINELKLCKTYANYTTAMLKQLGFGCSKTLLKIMFLVLSTDRDELIKEIYGYMKERMETYNKEGSK